MTSLVTGANGFLGNHVARVLLERGECVRVLVRRQSDCRRLMGLTVEYAYGDLRDPASLDAALRGVKRVFHVAADYRLWCLDPQEIYESNVTGTRHLLDAAGQACVETFVYTSTVATIAVARGGNWPNEDNRTSLAEMIGHYKRSKFLAEQEALSAASKGLPVIVVNPTTPVGPGDWKPTPTGRIILDFLNGKMPAYVDTGLNVVAVEDAAVGHLLAAERGKVGERYLLGGRNMLLLEILAALSKVSGRPCPSLRIPHTVALAAGYVDNLAARILRREPRIPLEGVRMARHKMFVDCSKAQRDLGFQPGPAEAALERASQWYMDNGYVSTRSVGRAKQRAA